MSKNIDLIKNSLTVVEALMKDLKHRKHQLMLDLSEANCPYEIGDILEDQSGRLLIVDDFLPSGYDWELEALGVKKNGTVGKKTYRVFTWSHTINVSDEYELVDQKVVRKDA